MSKKTELLIQKLLNGQCTEQELAQLEVYFQRNDLEGLEQELRLEWERRPTQKVSSEKKELLLKSIMAQVAQEQQTEIKSGRTSSFKMRSLLKYAALFLAFVGLSFFFFNPWEKAPHEVEAITVELEDGTVKSLDSWETLVRETDFVMDQGQLVYTPKESSKEGVLEYITLRVPLGESISLLLSDGSEVMLNAGSSLKYPKRFLPSKGREVQLTGEAYFQVAHNSEEPFLVRTGVTTTQVLGTRFNISAYPEEPTTQIVLVEGRVAVSSQEGEDTLLEPNEMAELHRKSANISVSPVDAQDHIAWTRGILLFRNQPFKEILPKLERHYNVEIENKSKKLLEKRFTGRFRNENIELVLETFERATDYKFRLRKDKIIINPKN